MAVTIKKIHLNLGYKLKELERLDGVRGNLDCFSGWELTIWGEVSIVSVSRSSKYSKMYGLLIYILGQDGSGSLTVDVLVLSSPYV